jgi:hypothetical protein
MKRDVIAGVGLAAIVACAATFLQCGGAPSNPPQSACATPSPVPRPSGRAPDLGPLPHGRDTDNDGGADHREAARSAPDAAATSDAIVRAGWLAGGRQLFVVSPHGALTVDRSGNDANDAANAGPHAQRCAFPTAATVLGVSGTGRVALDMDGEGEAGELALVDVPGCVPRRTGIRALGTGSGVNGGGTSGDTGRVSDDGARIILEEDSDTSVRVFDVLSAKLLATCSTHPPAGGPNVAVELSGDGAALVWRHGRNGTWVQMVTGCDRTPPVDVAATGNPSALVSPHRRFVVDCPYVAFGTEVPVRGYPIRALPGDRVVAHLASGALAPDDYGLCATAPTAFSPDDERVALADGGRVHVFAVRDGHEIVQIGEVTLAQTLGEAARGLAFSPSGDALAVWGSRHAVFFGLRDYEAYARAIPATYEDQDAALKKAVQGTVDLGDGS